jgi:FixJ family two-component response regulator
MSENPPTVFIVDDDPSSCAFLSLLVNSIGLRAEVFASAEEFLSKVRPDGPGCLVLDIQMPGLSGLDLQRELARTDFQIPIIFITGYGDIPMSVQAIKAGAVGFLTKPIRVQELLDNIREAINRNRLGRDKQNEIATAKSCERCRPIRWRNSFG